MKDLSRHIEYLLCNQNSVAIPGIGVFVTEDIKAKYCMEENLYLPPVRGVYLNTEQTEDDGKLENCLVQLHRITHNVAKKWISEYTQDINQSLMDMGYMDMGTIGRLVMRDGNILFEVCDAGVNAPELYGLDSFQMPKLPKHAHKKHVYQDQTHVTIRLRRTTVHRLMTAAAMIIVALTVILPNYGSLNLSERMNTQMASVESLKTFFSTNPQPIAHPITIQTESTVQEQKKDLQKEEITVQETEETPILTITDEAETLTSVSEVNIEEASIAPVENELIVQQDASTITETTIDLEVKGYCVVMASAITNKGAELLIKKLNKEGFINAVKYNDKGMLRVVLTGYANEQEARSDMGIVRTIDNLYSGSWLKYF